MPKKVPKSTLTPLTDEQVRELALGIFRNEIFTECHIAERDMNMLPTIFMPLGFMDKKAVLDMQRKQRPGLMYAKMAECGPRSVNGYPMFFSVSMCSEPDAEKVWAEHKRLTEAAKAV